MATHGTGAKLYYGGSANEITPLYSLTAPAAEHTEIDITSLSSTAKQNMAGLVDHKEISFEAEYSEDLYDDLDAVRGITQGWKVVFPDGSYTEGAAWLKTLELEMKPDEKDILKGTVRCTGAWTFNVVS